MGFEITRFDQISEDFLCPICQDVLEDPIQISTCEHIFCTVCITQWVETCTSCPVDRLTINVSEHLKETSRFFRNQYNKLRIKCKFSVYGCEEIVEVERLMNHQSNCWLNPDLKVECDNGCGEMLGTSEHQKNLIANLEAKVNTQNEDISALQKIIFKYEMASNACEELKELMKSLKQKGDLKSSRVENVMLAVDRSIFCTSDPYADEVQSINYGTVINAPSSHAKRLELLNHKLTHNTKVLDVGSGNGYLTFCMALMVGSNGKVIGIDHVRELVDQSNKIKEQHFPFLKSSQIRFVTGDGRYGYQSESPYDIINYGGSVKEVPQIVIDQLKPNGIILVQNTWLFGLSFLATIHKDASGTITKAATPYFGKANPLIDLESQLR